MKKALIILVTIVLAVGPTLARADTPIVKQPSLSRTSTSANSSKATRLTDAQLDAVVGGAPAQLLIGGGLVFLSNSGNASVNKASHHGTLICINQCI
jgi:hypothetical protein